MELGALLGSFSFANFAGLLCLYLLALVGSCGSCCWLLHLHLGLPSKKTWPLGLASLENPLPLLLPCALRLGLWCHLGSRFLLRRAWGRKGWSTACRAAWVISLSSLCKSHISIFANIVQHCGKVRPSQLGNCYLPPKLAGGKNQNINHEHKYK